MHRNIIQRTYIIEREGGSEVYYSAGGIMYLLCIFSIVISSYAASFYYYSLPGFVSLAISNKQVLKSIPLQGKQYAINGGSSDDEGLVDGHADRCVKTF
jgi:hypothetical protein